LYQFLCFLGVVVLHQGYQKHLPPIRRALYHQVPTYLVYMLHGLIGLFVLYLILVTIFHLLFEIALQENLEQAVLATIRSVVYHGISGSICFIHAQQSIWIKTEGIQLHQEISSRQFPPNGWKKLSRFQTMIQNYNTYSGNAVSIPLLFYFAAAASSCLTLASYDGWARFLLVALIGCASSVVYLMVFFSTAVSAQGPQIIDPLYWTLPDTWHSRLDHCELGSEIGGFAVSTTGCLRGLLGLGGFVFAFIPLASYFSLMKY